MKGVNNEEGNKRNKEGKTKEETDEGRKGEWFVGRESGRKEGRIEI